MADDKAEEGDRDKEKIRKALQYVYPAAYKNSIFEGIEASGKILNATANILD